MPIYGSLDGSPGPGEFGSFGVETLGDISGISAWGEPDTNGDNVHAGKIELGHGHSMVLNQAVLRALKNHPIVRAAMLKRADAVADTANEIGVPRDRDGLRPLYAAKLTDHRAIVKMENYYAVVDNNINATLLKAMDQEAGTQ